MDSFNLAIYGIENASIPSKTTTESWLPASDLSSLQFVHTCVCEYVASFFFFSLSHIEALPQPHLTFITRERACILIEASSATVFPFVSAFITSLECRCWVHYGFSFEIILASVHHIMLLHFRQAAKHSVMAFLHSLLFRRSLALSSICRIRIEVAVYVVVYLCKNWILLAHVDAWAIPLLVNHTIKLNACTYQSRAYITHTCYNRFVYSGIYSYFGCSCSISKLCGSFFVYFLPLSPVTMHSLTKPTAQNPNKRNWQ